MSKELKEHIKQVRKEFKLKYGYYPDKKQKKKTS